MRNSARVKRANTKYSTICLDQLAVRRECDRLDKIRMALERAARRSRRGVPEPDRLVVRPRGDQLAVRRECDRRAQNRIAAVRAQRSVSGYLPKMDNSAEGRRVGQVLVPRFWYRRAEN